jgi:hypothetical protein
MSTNTKSEQHKNIINIINYKISIAKQINWCLNHIDYNKTWNNIDELYNCYKLVFKNNKLYPQLSGTDIDDIMQEFTIHHFIYYLIKEVVKIFKRRSKRFTEYDIIELLLMNVQSAYEIHLDNLINKLYDYLYPTANLKTLSNIFLIFKNIPESFSGYTVSITSVINNYCNFTTWTEYNLLYNLMNYIETLEDKDDSIICLIYYEINQNIKHGKCSMNDVIQLIQTYEHKRTQERLKKYEEDFIMKTWHPTRLMDWCLDIEEKKDFVEEIEIM